MGTTYLFPRNLTERAQRARRRALQDKNNPFKDRFKLPKCKNFMCYATRFSAHQTRYAPQQRLLLNGPHILSGRDTHKAKAHKAVRTLSAARQSRDIEAR